MLLSPRTFGVVALLAAGAVGTGLHATEPSAPEAAEHSMKQFLAQGEDSPSYRAKRRLEAKGGGMIGWLEAATEYAPQGGFRYTVTAEGGASRIRGKLRDVLEFERETVARGEAARSALAPCNYAFQPSGLAPDGLVKVLLSPRREERVLVNGAMFLRPVDGELVRLQGRLAKSPSFWVKNVDIVRTYARVEGTVMPVVLESNAQLRLFGDATLRMTYSYSEIDGRPVASPR
jgi:hypothetical protein